jgi:hypothetical protein
MSLPFNSYLSFSQNRLAPASGTIYVVETTDPFTYELYAFGSDDVNEIEISSDATLYYSSSNWYPSLNFGPGQTTSFAYFADYTANGFTDQMSVINTLTLSGNVSDQYAWDTAAGTSIFNSNAPCKRYVLTNNTTANDNFSGAYIYQEDLAYNFKRWISINGNTNYSLQNYYNYANWGTSSNTFGRLVSTCGTKITVSSSGQISLNGNEIDYKNSFIYYEGNTNPISSMNLFDQVYLNAAYTYQLCTHIGSYPEDITIIAPS